MPNYTMKMPDGSLGATEQKDAKAAAKHAKALGATVVFEGNDTPKQSK